MRGFGVNHMSFSVCGVHYYPVTQGVASERFVFKALREYMQTFQIDLGFTIP